MLLSSLTFALMGGAAKVLAQSLPPLEVTFFRNVFGVAIILTALFTHPTKSKGGKPLLLFFRGFIGFLALLAYFYLMAHIPLGVAVTYNKTSPLFLAFFAWLFLGEKLPKSAILALIFGFVGIVLIAKPDGFSLSKYDMLGIFSGIGAALAYTSIRELKNYYDTRQIALSFMAIGTIGPIILMILAEFVTPAKGLDFLIAKFAMPKAEDWIYIVIVGVSATISQLLMTKAYSLTKAGIVGTITYTQILFAVLIGTALGDKFPDFWTIMGMISIVIAGLLVILPKQK
jgi:drug/metabolite transporter (DMT)-like permease